ncbi:MAG TPA: amidohydrolase [Bryobacteraceae bacterium]|nr:amidohydrolase [Bryobacteraceae bacterium]
MKPKTAILALLAIAGSLAAAPPDDSQKMKAQAFARVDGMQKQAQVMADTVFSFAELGFQEFETSRYLSGVLRDHGFKIENGVAGMPTAWVASWGTGKPVLGLISDIDALPAVSQKPGVAYHAPLIDGAPGHGEGHNSGTPANILAAIAVKELMERNKLSGTLRVYPGVAEELLAAKAYYVRAGLFKDVDLVLGCHVDSKLSTTYGQGGPNAGLLSVLFQFHGKTAHAGSNPWQGRSALDAVELMNAAWNMKREHLRTQQRSHYVIVDGGEQPNIVPSEASVWYFFREMDRARVLALYETAAIIAGAAAQMAGVTETHRVLGGAWPMHFNKVIAEAQQVNIEMVGMPAWSEADQALAKAVQKQIGATPDGLRTKVTPLAPPEPQQGGGSDDLGDISWTVPTVYMRYPANIPGLPGHHWANAVAMATPIAHKGVIAAAKVQAATAIDFLLSPELVQRAWTYFRDVQTKDVKYEPIVSPDDQPATDLNRDKMERFRSEMRKYYYDAGRYPTYLDQLGVRYPTLAPER